MPKNNKRATFDVTPELLPQIVTIMPAGYYIAGSEYARGGIVRLVLEGASVVEDGEHLQMTVTEDAGVRTISMQKSEVKPSYA